MSGEKREEGGRFAEVVPLDDVLAVFERVEGPVVTSGDVADHLECSRETARRKLRELEERGRLASRLTAGRVVWWQADGGHRPSPVDPDDSFWELPAGNSGEGGVSEAVDDALYDE